MFSKIKDKINFRIFPALVSWALFVKTLIPMLVISKYNHSNQDDFWMSADAHHVWDATHSVWATIVQAWKDAVLLWQNWDGCLLSMFIGGLPPLVFHEDYYKYTFVVLAGSMMLALIVFLYVLLVRVFKFDILHYLIICPLMMFLFLNMMPSAKAAYYWWVGGINYTFFFAVFLIAQSFVLEYMVSKKKVFLVIGSIFSFAVGLGNLLSGLVNPIILVLECAFFIMINKKKGILFVIPTVSGIAGLLCNVLAPGNLIRGGEGLFGASVFGAIWETIVASTNFIPHFYRGSMICVFVFIAIAILDGFNKDKVNFKFPYPIAFLVLSYLVYCSVFTPVIYANSAFYGRCKNVSFGMMMFMYLINIIYIIGWAYNKFGKLSDIKLVKIKHLAIYPVFAIMILCVAANKKTLDYYSAQDSLVIGQAQSFDSYVDARFDLYYDNSIKDVVVEEITWIPPIFYWDDQCIHELENYFYKNSITVAE